MDYFQKIYSLIEKNELEQAVTQVKAVVDDTKYLKELLYLKNRYVQLKKLYKVRCHFI